MQRCQLQQSYASDKAAWEVKWTEMKCQVAQVQMASQHSPLCDQAQSGVGNYQCTEQEDSKHVGFPTDEILLREKQQIGRSERNLKVKQ